MLFRRRDAGSALQRLKTWIWPRVSWRRSTLYFVKRTLRLSGSPYAIAMGVAAGVFVSCTPFIGFHFVLAFAAAWLLGGNLIAAAIGTAFGNPLTFPFIWAATYEFGHLLLRGFGRDAPARLNQDLVNKSLDQLWPVLKPMMVGSIPIGLAGACVSFFLVYNAVRAYPRARRQRLADRREAEATAP